MQANITLPKPLIAIYAIFALLFIITGLALAFSPSSILPTLEASAVTLQAGFGFILAATLNIFCIFPSPLRSRLHSVLLVFLIASLAVFINHGGSALIAAVAVVIYTLPLFPWAKLAERATQQERKPRKPRLARTPSTKPSKNIDRTGHEHGEVKWFNPNKGFGFILADDGREVFVHFRALDNGGRRSLQQGVRVSFTVRASERGEQAEQVYIHKQ